MAAGCASTKRNRPEAANIQTRQTTTFVLQSNRFHVFSGVSSLCALAVLKLCGYQAFTSTEIVHWVDAKLDIALPPYHQYYQDRTVNRLRQSVRAAQEHPWKLTRGPFALEFVRRLWPFGRKGPPEACHGEPPEGSQRLLRQCVLAAAALPVLEFVVVRRAASSMQ